MIESLRVLGLLEDGGERQAYRPADDPQHDRLRPGWPARSTAQPHPHAASVRTLASWRPDLTAYRDLDSAYRIWPQIPRPPLPSLLHDEIADLRHDDRRHGRTGPESRRPQFDRPHRRRAASPYGRRQSGKIALGSQLRIAMRRQPGSGVVGKDRQASSAQSWRDRAANSALHIIAIGRLRTDQRTKDYVARRLAEGHSKLDAIRALKRYLAREVFTLITQRRKEINATRIVA